MSRRSKVPLARLLSVLDPTLLHPQWLPADAAPDVLDVVIWDVVHEPSVSPGDLVLGVGLPDESSVVDLLGRLGPRRPAGLVVKTGGSSRGQAGGALQEAAARSGVPLVRLTDGASWEQVVVFVRSLLLSASETPERAGATGAVNDLFELAEVVSAVLEAPVTVEDRSSRVLAFSGHKEVDRARSETILGRRVPERFMQVLEARGIFRRLIEGTQPVYIERLSEEMLPRVAVGIHAAHEMLGSIWVAAEVPLSSEQEEWLVDVAKLAAYHFLRLRAEVDVGQQVRGELLAGLLAGGKLSADTADQLGLGAGPSCVVAAMAHPSEPTSAEAALQRLVTSLSVHLAAVRPRSAVARVDGTVYAVISPVAEQDHDGREPASLMEEFVKFADRERLFLIGVGRPVRSATELARSRADADKALSVLGRGLAGGQVARFVDIQLTSLMLRLSAVLQDDEELVLGPIGELDRYDRLHHTSLLETLTAYLDAFGDVAAAAGAVHVHPNTFRYRLRRLAEIGGIDLSGPSARFEAMLLLRLRALGPGGETTTFDGMAPVS